jgi:peptidoglycan hydrolase CwlO-like protein
MKVSYGKTIAIAVFLAGTLAGCAGDAAKVEELEGQLAAANKELTDIRKEIELREGDISALQNELKAAQAGYEQDTEELREYQKLGRPQELMKKP